MKKILPLTLEDKLKILEDDWKEILETVEQLFFYKTRNKKETVILNFFRRLNKLHRDIVELVEEEINGKD